MRTRRSTAGVVHLRAGVVIAGGLAVVACGDDRRSSKGDLGDAGVDAASAAPDASPDAERQRLSPPKHTFLEAGIEAQAPSGTGGGPTKGLGDGGDPPGITNPNVEPIPQCGDGTRTLDEECDDGNANNADFCTDACVSTPIVVVDQSGPIFDGDGGGRLPGRYLGEGRHPIAAGDSGFAVALVEPNDGYPRVMLQLFDAAGQRTSLVEVSTGTEAVLFSDPVVAALPGGAFAVAYTEYDGDGDGLGIALRRVTAAGAVSPPQFANAGTEYSQYDPDILWDGHDLIVAWADDSDAVNGPDIRYRLFDETTLAPQGGDITLAGTAAVEGRVSLATFKNKWAAAWRESTIPNGTANDGKEVIVIRHESYEWRTELNIPGPAESLPALVELDTDHLLLAFTTRTDPLATGIADTPFVRLSLLPTAATGTVSSVIVEGSPDFWTPYLPNDQPTLVRVGTDVFITVRLGGNPSMGDDIYRRPLVWAPTGSPTSIAMLDRTHPPELITAPALRTGDQRYPAHAASPFNDGALFTAWDTHAYDDGIVHAQPDVLAMLQPVPIGVQP